MNLNEPPRGSQFFTPICNPLLLYGVCRASGYITVSVLPMSISKLKQEKEELLELAAQHAQKFLNGNCVIEQHVRAQIEIGHKIDMNDAKQTHCELLEHAMRWARDFVAGTCEFKQFLMMQRSLAADIKANEELQNEILARDS